jgi:hypothetical protein
MLQKTEGGRMKTFLTRGDVARRLNISITRVRQLEGAGELVAAGRAGTVWLFAEDQVTVVIERRKRIPGRGISRDPEKK